MNSRYPILFVLVIIITAFTACKNNDNVFPKKVSSFVNIVNASTDTLNFYLNGTRQNNNSSLFPLGQSFYINVPSGSDNLQFKKSNTVPVLFTFPVTLKDSLYYSVYLTGETADKAFMSVDSLFVDSGFSSVKFVNASPDAGTLKVTLNDTVYFNNSVFKATSKLLTATSGAKTVKVYLAGATTPTLDTTFTFSQNTVYTLFTKGLLTGKGSATFNVGISLNGTLTF